MKIYLPSSLPRCDFILSEEYNQRYIKTCLDSSKLYNGSELGRDQQSASIH